MDYELQTLWRVHKFHDQILKELMTQYSDQEYETDILVVVHNQLDYIKICLESIFANTQGYNLYVWDNGSDATTRDWLRAQVDQRKIKILLRSEENLGFIIPNNELIKLTKSPYIILLNSDTAVQPGWDKVMVSYLDLGYAQVGYGGGIIGKNWKGESTGYGSAVDYLEGWCFGIKRETFERFGLFDAEHLNFAYCEDADFSLRLQEAGLPIYALYSGLVQHFGHKTIEEVSKKRDCRKSYEENHLYLKERWSPILTEIRRRAASDPVISIYNSGVCGVESEATESQKGLT